MLWLAVLFAFCGAPAVGLLVSLIQRAEPVRRKIRGFDVIIIDADDPARKGIVRDEK